ncbi:MAG TPA: GNAT family N-acetyltransferase [Jeotgalicoccus sp.]|nr:GNAT family N-acetyltransferase [Jeotgalicoccus sp.]
MHKCVLLFLYSKLFYSKNNIKMKECVSMLERLDKNEFERLYALMDESFPPAEIRDFKGQQMLLDKPDYNVYVLRENGEILAFFAEWVNKKYRFVEHLAVNEKYRSQGLGSKTLQAYNALSSKPVILEVEPPEDEIQRRRIKFYERNGFHLSSYSYIQPVINEGHEQVPLVLMTYPELLDNDTLAEVKNWLDQTVYKS